MVFLACLSLMLPVGCGSSQSFLAPAAATALPVTPGALEISPSTATAVMATSLAFNVVQDSISESGTVSHYSASSCNWQSDDESVLQSRGDGAFLGAGVGSANISATCGNQKASATAVVTDAANPKAIRITKGGTYSGNWSSMDPKTPAVLIQTDDPVTITNSTVTGKGTLILVYGGAKGGNVTVTNVTGIGLDPGVAGLGRGKFIDAQVMSQLTVKNCTMKGTSFGVYVVASNASSITVANNMASNLDDRISDGKGGYLLNKRVLGHFIMFNQVVAAKGADIGWNQIINTPGQASIEDVISMFESHGGDSTTPIRIHDNYLEGAFATGLTTGYTGGGIQMDGGANDAAHANGYILITENYIIRTANFGVSIAAGHDISALNNRVVSCGQDGKGNWLNFMGVAFGMWNYYNTTQYYKNLISGNTGGLITLDKGKPVNSDFYTQSVSATLHNVISGNPLEHPCWVNGVLSQSPEAVELPAWEARVASANLILGDRH